jgi:hypothetical protein
LASSTALLAFTFRLSVIMFSTPPLSEQIGI